MELPPITRSINPASKSPSKKTQKEIMDNVELLKENFSPFLQKMNKIIEIRIYLKATFHKSDIDDNFIFIAIFINIFIIKIISIIIILI